SKKLKRKARKRGSKAKNLSLIKEKVCVFISRDRNKNTINKIFEKFNAKFLSQEFISMIANDSLLCSDNKTVYKKFTKENSVRHGYINLSKGEKVKKDIVHIKNVNSYHYRLKDWIKRFHGVATKYLLNYLSWFKQLDEFNMEINPKTILLRAKNIGKYKYQYLTVT
ncbi:MAG: IS1595 family transposase, partial [Arcobacter sp.]|nr:IS1595 family transposase [Arcobacter sp.]